MKKIRTLFALALILSLLLCIGSAASAMAPAAEPQEKADPIESAEPVSAEEKVPAAVADPTYRGRTYTELGFTPAQISKIVQKADPDEYITSYLLIRNDYGDQWTVAELEKFAEHDANVGYSPADRALRLRKVEYVWRAEADPENADAIWLEFAAEAGGFESVDAYLKWKAEWEESITPTAEEIAQYEKEDAARQQAKKDANGGYMGCIP